jgi:hypothetical protein
MHPTSNYLSATELADLIQCRPNQHSKMASWLLKRNWKFEVGSTGLPRVSRAYHDRKMGISDVVTQFKLSDTPNLNAFVNAA